ncbi:MAG: sel1 repeat family protein [Myxococcales bacterium]|nr:sel1 repeat family protein [Myxococcales bacterium]
MGGMCRDGKPDACFNLGVVYDGGIGNRQDGEKAAEFFGLACELGDQVGCANLGAMYALGKGASANQRKRSNSREIM